MKLNKTIKLKAITSVLPHYRNIIEQHLGNGKLSTITDAELEQMDSEIDELVNNIVFEQYPSIADDLYDYVRYQIEIVNLGEDWTPKEIVAFEFAHQSTKNGIPFGKVIPAKNVPFRFRK